MLIIPHHHVRTPEHRWRRLTGGWCLVVAVLLVMGCATAPDTVVPLESSGDSWQLRRQALLGLDEWRLNGRLSFRFEEQAWHASFSWVQKGENYDLDLSGPLGQGRVRIQGKPGAVRVTDSEGRVLSGRTPEAVIWSEFGWVLPVRGLAYWIRGVSDPKQPVTSITLDSLGRLQTLIQVGWKIAYTEYREQESVDLPRKIRIDGEDINLRIVTDKWVINPEDSYALESAKSMSVGGQLRPS